ncbi:hypothetical protein THMIRHAS_01670 [Thiosulfatimonas sediminis]|uniref:Uncharacterized protein n=1 Tax=Thiosulfatimonas sediminis TaxID=2675054 RepID=A0A6F8PRY3_9GAMM|nr:hypothetical protein [Thiosulfatimonas sediminis]BBP44794.1 hypothetical protein THMIRHAS_01670 [Thiosulfatimonas sediminis]
MKIFTLRNGLLATLLGSTFWLNGCVVQHHTVVQAPAPHQERYYNYRFSQDDNYRLYDYYHPHYKSKDKYKKKGYQRTPPGHYKRPYYLHQPLPDKLRYQRLPRDIEARLPRIPDDLIRVRIGGDIVLIHRKTRVVYDILFDF